MPQLKTQRPYQERFLDNFDRSQLRREVQAVRPRRFAGLKKKYTTWALGASLALGGIGTPLAILQNKDAGAVDPRSAASVTIDDALEEDIQTARSIAEQVAGGVEAVAHGVESATTSPLQALAEAP